MVKRVKKREPNNLSPPKGMFQPNGLLGQLSESTSSVVVPKNEPAPDGQDGIGDESELDESEDENPGVFKLRDALEEPAYQRSTTDELHKLIHEGEIELSPSYQRDVVWTAQKQSSLVESIFKNYYVPPIVFAVHLDEDGEEVRICVDGKQRLTSIQKFMDGQIPYKDSKTKKTFWYTVPDNLMRQRQLLPLDAKRMFSSKMLTCMEYRGLSPAAEREIFQRVQMGVTLTMAEKLQAISSPWADWIAVIESRHVQVEGGLTSLLDWDTKRGRDFQNIAYMMYCCDGLPTTEQVPSNQKLEKFLSRVDPPRPAFQKEMEEVLEAFWKIASNPSLNHGLRNGKRLAPVEFIYIGVMLFILRSRSIEERAKAVSYLRDSVRKEFRDIRTNGLVCKYMWTLIWKLEKGGISSMGHASEDVGRKRRKPDSGSGDDDDYRPSPVSSLGASMKTRFRKR